MRPYLYIQPALTDIAGQCRIYYVPESPREPRKQTQRELDAWREVGLMNSRGELVCLSREFQHVITRADEPLMAGTSFPIEDASKHPCGESFHPRHPADCYYCRLALDNQIAREIAARSKS